MIVCTYYYDGETALRVNGELVPFSTGADIRNLMLAAYEAGEKKEGFIATNKFSDPHAEVH